MKIAMADFLKKHREICRLDEPGYSAPFALWKMEKLCEDAEAFCLPEHDCYYVIRNKFLLIYYSPDAQCHIPMDVLNSLECISLKASIFEPIKDGLYGFEISYPEGLHYDKAYIPPALTGDHYDTLEFDFSDDAHYRTAASNIGGNFTEANIKRIRDCYLSCGVFDPSLWFFIRDKQTGKLIGQAISTYQESIKETVLDWIHILPESHGKGAGRFMIQEIIRRSLDRSDVISVGGVVEFYKKCGFYTNAIYAWAAKPGFEVNGPFT